MLSIDEGGGLEVEVEEEDVLEAAEAAAAAGEAGILDSEAVQMILLRLTLVPSHPLPSNHGDQVSGVVWRRELQELMPPAVHEIATKTAILITQTIPDTAESRHLVDGVAAARRLGRHHRGLLTKALVLVPPGEDENVFVHYGSSCKGITFERRSQSLSSAFIQHQTPQLVLTCSTQLVLYRSMYTPASIDMAGRP
jgi:hypothetical protein